VQAVRKFVIDILTPEQLDLLAEVGEAVGVSLTTENCQAAAADECDPVDEPAT
jgi:hypothetical protein